ncbi:MAG: adenylate/guanylate cyclase domain-containing protein [Candidatus Omnitrophota bacterium]|nr:adenylate/guanylate cyclase domain-containing protein [Candidatus Omnitrophota bacterium]
MKRIGSALIPYILLIGLLGLRIATPTAVDDLQLNVFDTYQRIKPRQYEPAPVRVIDIDEESLSRLGQWPWPRTLVAGLVKRATDFGVAVIAFDVLFAEPDRSSPENILPFWPQTPGVKTLLSQIDALPKHDEYFAETLASSRVVTGFNLTMNDNGITPQRKAGFAHGGDDPKKSLVPFNGAILNLPEIEKASMGNGSFNFFADHDAIIRRVPFLFRLKQELYPSLTGEALRVAQDASTYIIKSSGASGEMSFGEYTGIVSVKIGQFAIPTDAEGRMWLYDTGFIKERRIPAWKLLDESYDGEEINGAILFVGTSAAGLKDLRTTPLDPLAAGVDIHAQLAEQIIHQEFLYRPDWAPGAEFLFVLILGLILIILMPRLGAAWCAIIGLVGAGTAVGLSWYFFTNRSWLVDPIVPSLMCLILYIVVSLISFLRTETEKAQVRAAFSRYMNPALVERLAQHPEQLKLGGETRNMTLLFADIRGFTTISENLDAQELTNFINRFLTPMTDFIMKESGTIDKYMGDCIMAFWNAPLDDPNHASNACQAALNMRNHMLDWNTDIKAEFEAKGKPYYPVHIGIGLNTGDCCVGNMGSEQRFDYSALGDNVNLASRLEGQSKNYNADIIIGKNTYDEASGFAAVEVDLIRVKGKKVPVHIFALLGDSTMKEADWFQTLIRNHGEMLTAYRGQRWNDALKLIDECWKWDTPRTRLQILYNLYQERIRFYQAHPPGTDWDGVYIALSK